MGLSVGLGILVLLLLNIQTVNSTHSTNLKYKIRQNCKILANFLMEENTAVNLTACVIKCTVTPICISVAWNRNTYVCTLSGKDTIYERPHIYRYHKEANGWTCASIIQFPVLLLIKETYAINRYEMTFAQASARCAELGTRLAHPSELAAAQNLGLHTCTCGWMSDGRNALIINTPITWCIGIWNEGPIECSYALADAWCLAPDYHG